MSSAVKALMAMGVLCAGSALFRAVTMISWSPDCVSSGVAEGLPGALCGAAVAAIARAFDAAGSADARDVHAIIVTISV